MADSSDSSPHSAADDAHHPDNNPNNNAPEAAAPAAAVAVPTAVAAPPAPQVPAKVRLMVSYGGRIQPRPHDNQLSYVNGDTKILCIERPLRFPDFAARLAVLAGTRENICVKYQLPGEDLDALVSVTNDEDLEHLVIEYDRLHLFRPSAPGSGGSSRGGGGGGGGGSTPRLRVFLFPVQPPRPVSPPAALMPKPEQREWYLDLKSVSPPPPPQALPPPQLHQNQQPQMRQETVPVQSPPPATAVPMAVPQSVMVASQTGPDYLFGFDYGFMPPPAVKVKDPAGDPPKMRENVPVEIPPKNEDRHPNPAAADNNNNNNAMASPAVSPAEFPRQIPDLDKLQLADNATQQQPPAPAPAPAPATPIAPAPAPAPAPVVAPAAPVAAPLSRNGSDDSLTRAYPPATATPTAAAEYYVSKFPEKPPVPPPSSAPPATAFLPVPGRYASVAPGSGAEAGPFFFIPAPPHGYFATSANPGGTSYYAVTPHNGNANGNGGAPAPTVSSAPAYPQVAYDSNGRAIYYTGLLPQYPSAVNGGMSASTAVLNEPPKPVAVKPTLS